MSILLATDDKRMPIVIGAVEFLPLEAEKESAREIARRSIEKFDAGKPRRERQLMLRSVGDKIREKFTGQAER